MFLLEVWQFFLCIIIGNVLHTNCLNIIWWIVPNSYSFEFWLCNKYNNMDRTYYDEDDFNNKFFIKDYNL